MCPLIYCGMSTAWGGGTGVYGGGGYKTAAMPNKEIWFAQTMPNTVRHGTWFFKRAKVRRAKQCQDRRIGKTSRTLATYAQHRIHYHVEESVPMRNSLGIMCMPCPPERIVTFRRHRIQPLVSPQLPPGPRFSAPCLPLKRLAKFVPANKLSIATVSREACGGGKRELCARKPLDNS